MAKKKKILYHSDFSLSKTGFGRAAKALLKELYKTGKYEIVQYCCGLTWEHPTFKRVPWKCYGALPNDKQQVDALNKDPQVARLASYGQFNINNVIEKEKPDFYFGVQDIWGVDYCLKMPWWNKLHCVVHTTLDSLPILESAVFAAKDVKNYWVWSNFAEKALHKIGYNHVKTVHGAIETEKFYKLPESEKKALREKFGLPQDAYIIGFVFRNQLRKSVPNLLEGYAKFKKEHPEIKNTYLLLHTSFSEGWPIIKKENIENENSESLDLCKQYEIDPREILTSYVCRNCKALEVKNFLGENLDCKFCGAQKSQVTTSPQMGVCEDQLREVYNLMDVYCHPFTSGGQEIPVQEAKLCELITLVTNYSCGEELCQQEAYSIPLEWSKYTEHSTNFIKASTYPNSISKNLYKVFKMPKSKKEDYGRKARQWVLENYDAKKISAIFQDFIDNAEEVDYDFKFKTVLKNPTYEIPYIEDNEKWLKEMYVNILKFNNQKDIEDGIKYWLKEIKSGTSRDKIESYFRKVALQDNQAQTKKKNLDDLLDKDDEGKRIAVVMPESAGDVFLTTAILPSIKRLYKDHNIYFITKPQFFEILDGNPFVHKTIPFFQEAESLLFMEGRGSHKGYFEICYVPHVGTQRFLNYLHNAKDIIDLDIHSEDFNKITRE